MRRSLIAVFALLLIPIAWGQTSNVTATITDPDGQTWNDGTYTINFIPTPGVPGPFTWNGGQSFTKQFTGSFSNVGVLTISLPSNDFIAPSGSQWRFTLCPNASFQCTDVVLTVTGAAPNLSSSLSSQLPAIRFAPGIRAFGYLDIEVGTPAEPLYPGALYWNVTNVIERQWNGTIWQNLAGVAGSAAPPVGSVQINTAGNFGSVASVANGSYLGSAGTLVPPTYQSKLLVDVQHDFTGADWCAQVSAADAAFVGTQAILSVSSAMSGLPACTTSINLTSGHALQFGQGTFNLGTQSGRAGIRIGNAVNNVSVTGAGIGQSILLYTSVNLGAGNGFPNGAAIGIGRVTGCANDAAASNYITVSDLSIRDQNVGGALGSGHSPSGIDGACVNFMIIERTEFTDIKGNAAITVTGNFGGGGGNTYYNRDNIFDGTVAGGGGEFEGDNSSNWTHFYVLNNTFSRWPCAVGVSKAVEGLIANNTADMTLKAPFSGCSAIGIGAGSDTSGQLGNVFAVNNVVIMGFSGVALALFPSATLDNTSQLGLIGNNVYRTAGSSVTAISINGGDSTHSPPTMIVKNNTLSTDLTTTITGQLSFLEFAGNSFDGVTGNIPLFGCVGPSAAVKVGGSVRVYNNRIAGPTPGAIMSAACTDASFATRRFQEWDNTVKDGNLNSFAAATGNLGLPASVSWTPGTIAAYTSSGNQTATVTNAIAGDTVRIVNANGGSTWLSLPAGVIASGSVTSATTVTFNITNTTASPVTVNSGSAIQSYVVVDRPPNNAQTPVWSLNSSITLGASPNTSAQIGPVTARTSIPQGTPSVIIQEEAGFNPLEIHSGHQSGINLFSHDGTSALRAPAQNFWRSRGTQAAPSAVLSGDLLGVNNVGGFDSTTYAGGTLLHYDASENWNATSHGIQTTFAVVPNTTTTAINTLTLGQDLSATFAGAVKSPSYASSASNGGLSGTEGTGASVPAGAGLDVFWPDSTAHRWKMNNNNEATSENVAGTYAAGNVTTAGTAVNAGTCQAQTGITVTGALTSDNVVANIGAALPATWQTGIVLSAHVTAAATVTVYLCNGTAGNLTPAATQVNVRILR